MTLEPPASDFAIRFVDQIPVITIPRRLTVLEAIRFKEVSCHLLETDLTSAWLILDFSLTQFMDSSGIGSLVQILRVAKSKNIQLVLLKVNPNVMSVLSMTGLDRVFTLQNSLDPLFSTTLPPHQPDANSAKIIAGTGTGGLQPPKTHPSIRSGLKRAVDIVGALVGLSITGLIFIPIAIAIKLDSKGPIFFAQTRCGWLGKTFKMLKFRSMCRNAEALKSQVPNEVEGAIFKNKNDPRITKVGKFLRQTSLDELPQFWNVLEGEMSLVGTRPPTPEEVDSYEVPAWQRLDVKPGMTGEWQVNGRSKIQNFEDVIKLDLRYQENWSHWYDLQLILKTIFILFHKNSGAV
jgi:anti-anti-sigma factor